MLTACMYTYSVHLDLTSQVKAATVIKGGERGSQQHFPAAPRFSRERLPSGMWCASALCLVVQRSVITDWRCERSKEDDGKRRVENDLIYIM